MIVVFKNGMRMKKIQGNGNGENDNGKDKIQNLKQISLTYLRNF